VGSNSEIFWPVPSCGDVGVAGSTSRSRNDGRGQKSWNYEYELTARDTDMPACPAMWTHHGDFILDLKLVLFHLFEIKDIVSSLIR
jgi:hypothetical protein